MADGGANISENDCESRRSLDKTFLICNGVKPEIIQEILHESGYQAQDEEFDDWHEIRSSNNGSSFLITLSRFNDEHHSYQKISITAYYQSDKDQRSALKAMNRFNATCAYLKGYVEEEGGLAIQMDWLVGKGVTLVQLAQWLQLWRGGMIIFEDYWFARQG
jgi:hypothetical protein